jgi:hypothetical protein
MGIIKQMEVKDVVEIYMISNNNSNNNMPSCNLQLIPLLLCVHLMNFLLTSLTANFNLVTWTYTLLLPIGP